VPAAAGENAAVHGADARPPRAARIRGAPSIDHDEDILGIMTVSDLDGAARK
jgi:predicted transcriptional regulator